IRGIKRYSIRAAGFCQNFFVPNWTSRIRMASLMAADSSCMVGIKRNRTESGMVICRPIVQGRGHHGGEDAEQEQQDFRPWIQPESLPWGCSAVHAVIPAFSNCFFSILPPIHPLKAAMTSVPTTMTASSQEGAEALMV